MGSIGIDQDLLLPDQISLPGGISSFHLNDLLLLSIKDLFLFNLSILYILSMPQVIEQSLFLFPCTQDLSPIDCAGDKLKAMAAAGDPLWLALALDLEAMALAALAAVVIW